jgi:hypothetical protein
MPGGIFDGRHYPLPAMNTLTFRDFESVAGCKKFPAGKKNSHNPAAEALVIMERKMYLTVHFFRIGGTVMSCEWYSHDNHGPAKARTGDEHAAGTSHQELCSY